MLLTRLWTKPNQTLRVIDLSNALPHITLPFFEPHHQDLGHKLLIWCQNGLRVDHQDIDQACRQLVTDLGEQGFLQACVATEDRGFDVRSICLSREILAYHDGLADFSLAMQGLGSGAISLFGSPEQRQDYLSRVSQGQKIAAFALSEPDAGSDVAAMACEAKTKAGGFVINGQKTWISNGGIADFYCVFARTEPARQKPDGTSSSAGITAFIVDKDTPGLRISERIHVIAPHPLATLTFEECFIPAECVVGEVGQGFKVAMSTLDIFRTSVAAAALGFARRALAEGLAHAQNRNMFGGHLSDFQLTQAKLADMATRIDAATLLVYRAAWSKDQGNNVTKHAAMAKMFATESAQRVIDDAVQLFGGRGVVTGEMVERLYREIRSLRIYEGATEVQKLIIGRQLLRESEV